VGGALETEIHEQITQALKARDTVRLGALRMLAAAITNREKELRRELTDDEVREVAAREVKRRGESIEAFSGAGRTELADKEREERDVLTPYVPERLSEAEVDALIDEAIASTGASSPWSTRRSRHSRRRARMSRRWRSASSARSAS